jgi:hypothetical protein
MLCVEQLHRNIFDASIHHDPVYFDWGPELPDHLSKQAEASRSGSLSCDKRYNSEWEISIGALSTLLADFTGRYRKFSN